MTLPRFSRILYLSNTASDISGYKRAFHPEWTPTTEATLTGAGAVGAGDVLIKAWASDALGLTVWPAGVWQFLLWASVSNVTDTTQCKVKVYHRDSAGTETLLFEETSANIGSLTVVSIAFNHTFATPTATDVKDRIVVKLYHLTNSASSRTNTIYLEGTTHQSRVITPFDMPIFWLPKAFAPNGVTAGTGDVTGPGSSTAGNFPAFADTGGKTLEDSGYAPADFAAHDYVPSGMLTRNGSTTNHNLAVWNGANADSLEDGGAVPTGTGDVAGPATSTDHSIARFNGTDNKTIQGSLATVDDSGSVNIPTGQTYNINGSPHTHAGGAAAFHGCSASGSVTAEGGYTRIPATLYETIDTDAYHNASANKERFTIPAGLGGYYLVIANAEFNSSGLTADARGDLHIKDHNGDTFASLYWRGYLLYLGIDGPSIGGSGIVILAESEYIYPAVWMSGEETDDATITLSIIYLGPVA